MLLPEQPLDRRPEAAPTQSRDRPARTVDEDDAPVPQPGKVLDGIPHPTVVGSAHDVDAFAAGLPADHHDRDLARQLRQLGGPQRRPEQEHPLAPGVEQRQDAATRYGFEKALTDWRELLDDDSIDVVSVGAGFPHAHDLVDSIELAALLGVKRIVTMSGTPAGSPGGTNPVWNPLPWWSPLLDVRDYQWEVAIPFWKDIQARAADADVKIAVEMHPGNIVFNPSTMHRLAEEINATHVGAEMDPSHLFWQGIDPILAIADLGDLVYIAAAKDTRINEAAKVNGVLDDRFTRIVEDEPGYLPLGGGTTLSGWPTNSSWDFVAVGRGHDTAYWTEFLRALANVDPHMPVNIEHEDHELDQVDGLRFAANTLIEAAKAL